MWHQRTHAGWKPFYLERKSCRNGCTDWVYLQGVSSVAFQDEYSVSLQREITLERDRFDASNVAKYYHILAAITHIWEHILARSQSNTDNVTKLSHIKLIIRSTLEHTPGRCLIDENMEAIEYIRLSNMNAHTEEKPFQCRQCVSLNDL